MDSLNIGIGVLTSVSPSPLANPSSEDQMGGEPLDEELSFPTVKNSNLALFIVTTSVSPPVKSNIASNPL